MADKRTARRDATQAARKLLQGTLLAAAADLGEAHAGLAEARAGVDEAAARGQELVRQAHEAAERLVAVAREDVSEEEQTYAATWRAALDTGWTPAQLREMGYTTPAARRRTPPVRPDQDQKAGGAMPELDDVPGDDGGQAGAVTPDIRAGSGAGPVEPGSVDADASGTGPATSAGDDPAWSDPAAAVRA